ncbi:MAG: hypothetical protein ACOYJ7_03485 [Rhodoluna sp.]
MKKLVLVALSTLGLLLGSTVSISPASAFPWTPLVYTVGDSVSVNLGDLYGNRDIFECRFGSGKFPDGLTMDRYGLVTGVPTTSGSFTVSDYFCSWDGGAAGGSAPWISVNFQIRRDSGVPPRDFQYYEVGETVFLDLGCGPNTAVVTFDFGSLPTGLSMDATGLLTGVPVSQGFYTLGGYHCQDVDGNVTYDASWNLMFNIGELAVTPMLAAHNLNTANCEFYVGTSFPVWPDQQSIFLEVANQSGSIARMNQILDNGGNTVPEFTLIEKTYNPAHLNEIASNNAGSVLSGDGFKCGDTLSITVGYRKYASPVSTKTVTGVVIEKPAPQVGQVGSEPELRVINLNNADCEFRVIGKLPSTPTPGSTHLLIGSVFSSYDMILQDSYASNFIDLTFKPTDLENSVSSKPEVAQYFANVANQSDFTCGGLFQINLDYDDLAGSHWTSTQNQTPTKPEEVATNTFSISAGQSNLGICNVSVIISAPDYARPITVGITDGNSTESFAGVVIRDQASNNGLIAVNISLRSKDETSASVEILAEDKYLEGTPSCSGTYQAIIDSMGGVLAATVFTLTDPLPTCNAGSIREEERARCTPVERGFYTTELNSTVAIACPAGMTTATIASKSINDCYKPIVQSIVGFKPTKALKFSGTANLAVITNTKAVSDFTVAGPCTAKLANITSTVKGKKVTTKMLKVTAGKKAGTCSIKLTSPTTGKYLGLSKAVKIKVSKTGK